MNVKNSLPCRSVAVEDRAIAVIRMTPFARDLLCYKMYFAYQLAVHWFQVVERRDVLARDDEHVRRRLGIDVFERQHVVALVDQIARDFPVANLAEEAVAHGVAGAGAILEYA